MQSNKDRASENPIQVNLVDLFMSGLNWLEHTAQHQKTVKFSEWVKVLRSARGQSNELTRQRLFWLWEALTSEPSIRERLGKRLITFDDEWKRIQPVECLPEKTKFGIFLQNFESMGYPVSIIPSTRRPDAEAEILSTLYMAPGTSWRLKCQDVPTILTLRLINIKSEQEEAAALKVDKKDIEIKNGCLLVHVKSLNHAYTKASLRLEPHRRGHGGKAYDHVAKLENDKYIPLEKIRIKKEEILKNQIIDI